MQTRIFKNHSDTYFQHCPHCFNTLKFHKDDDGKIIMDARCGHLKYVKIYGDTLMGYFDTFNCYWEGIK